MFEILFWIFAVLLCIACEGFFSGTETAMISLDRARLKALAQKGSEKAAQVDAVLDKPESFFSTTLFGTNMSVVLGNTIATFMVIKYLGESYEYLTIFIMSPLLLVFGEIIPKTVYRYHAKTVTTYIVLPLKIISVIFYPFVLILSWLTRFFVKLTGLNGSGLKPHATKEDLENYLKMWKISGSLKTAEKKIIERIFDFTRTVVEDIMIPLVNVKAIEANDSIEKAVRLAKRTGYSRIPVYSERIYNIIGIVHSFDLLTAQGKAQNLKEFMRPARYIPDSQPIDELLKNMRTEGNSIAVVVDEYGGSTGIVTIEDVLEEVVGEIYDEHDKQERLMARVGNRKYLINARISIDEFNEYLKVEIPEGDYETVAGFLLKSMGTIPEEGETFEFENIKFIIRQSDKRSIKEVLVVLSEDKEKTV
jgi:CBS domain containing-hemolysin-like protein